MLGVPRLYPFRNLNPLLFPSKKPKSIRTLSHTHLFLPSSSHGSHTSPSYLHLSDQMPQRTPSVFDALNLLKHASVDADLVGFIHCLSLKAGVLCHAAARTSLLTGYARARDLDSSVALFDETKERDLIHWNAMISAFVLNSCFENAIDIFQEMVQRFGDYDSTTLVIMMSALSRTADLKRGVVLHGTIIKRRLDWDVYLCNALIDMYAKCDYLESADIMFKNMEFRDVSSWNSIIHGCFYNGFEEESTLYFREMRSSGFQADRVSLSCMISACSCSEELFGLGESLHSLVIKSATEDGTDSSVTNSLISFYSRHGEIDAAVEVFAGLNERNVVSWNSMINGLVENESFSEALDHFQVMLLSLTAQPDAATFVTIIPVFGKLNLLRQGKSVHGFCIRRDLESSDLSITNSLISMYSECGDLASADILFKIMPRKDLISWNTMIFGRSHVDTLKEDARMLFHELLQTGLRRSLASLLAILPSCTCPDDIYFGKALHCWQMKCGFASIVSATNALMLMYINCGDITASYLLLQSLLLESDIVSWNTFIVGCVQNGFYKDALEAFRFMRFSFQIHPDPITSVSVLSACGNLELLFDGMAMHGLVLKRSMVSDLRVKNALLTMYFRCEDADSAELVFHTGGDENLCSWNCMISGFSQNKKGGRALEFFRRMEPFLPNEISLVGVLCACAQLGNLRYGRATHGYVFRFGLQNNIFISSALVDMYSKCGRLDIAVRAFENSAKKSIASWNSMISAYGFHGQGKEAIEVFLKMSESGIKATKSTFIALLSACSHSGLVDEGLNQYKLMQEKFGIEPAIEHHVCIVAMLGRAGRLNEAYDLASSMAREVEEGVWGALLSACNDLANHEMAKLVAEHLFCVKPENTGYYVTLCNLYAYSGMWEDAVSTRYLIQDRRLKKPPGCSFQMG